MDRFQLKSMTAYGRGTAVFPYGRFIFEIQSVNRRFLEINVGLPRIFIRFEMDIRKQLAESIGRGALNVSLSWKSEGTQPISVSPNLSLARALKNAWENLMNELHMDEKVPLSLLAQEKDILLYEEEILNEEIYKRAIKTALQEAIDALLVMKKREGQILAADLKERVALLRSSIIAIKASSAEGTEKYRQKLQDRLQELFEGSPENEERILREVAVYAERIDITEEIVRFNGHLEQFENMLHSPLENELETRGKTLDFLIQELLRECNTIGSKASGFTISQHVVAIKSELERLREQVQNIE